MITPETATNEPPEIELLNAADLLKAADVHRREMDAVFRHDPAADTLTICRAYPYDIALERIPDKAALLGWVYHLSEKVWVDSDLLREFIERVCAAKGWKL
jgi:hypothetical protein